MEGALGPSHQREQCGGRGLSGPITSENQALVLASGLGFARCLTFGFGWAASDLFVAQQSLLALHCWEQSGAKALRPPVAEAPRFIHRE